MECAKFGNAEIFNDVWYLYEATFDGTAVVSFCPVGDGSVRRLTGSAVGNRIEELCPSTARRSATPLFM